MVASSVRDLRVAGHTGAFEADRKPCYGEVRDNEPVVRFNVHEPMGACTHPARAREIT
jgi:hypothetical protein